MSNYENFNYSQENLINKSSHPEPIAKYRPSSHKYPENPNQPSTVQPEMTQTSQLTSSSIPYRNPTSFNKTIPIGNGISSSIKPPMRLQTQRNSNIFESTNISLQSQMPPRREARSPIVQNSLFIKPGSVNYQQ